MAAAAASTAAAAAGTPASAAGPTRKTLFRKSGGDELLTAPESLDADEKASQHDKELVEEMLGALREEVKEMDRTNWLYETQDPQSVPAAVSGNAKPLGARREH